LDAMIGRHKRPVHGKSGTYLVVFLPNIRNVARVHVSYRAFLHGWALYGAFLVKQIFLAFPLN
jgi:hypothetical protein